MMETNFHSICQQLKDERATLESQLKEERKVILEQAKLEKPECLRFHEAQLLWYAAELKTAEEANSKLKRDLKASESAAKTPAEAAELSELKKEKQKLLVKVANLTAKSEEDKATLRAKVRNLRESLEIAMSQAEELNKRNKALDEFFRMVPPGSIPLSKRKQLTASQTQAPDHKRQKAAEAPLVSDKPVEKGEVNSNLAAQAPAPVAEGAELEAKATPATKPRRKDFGSPAEEGLINEDPPPVEVTGLNPDLHLFTEGGALHQECCIAKLPDASFLAQDEIVVTESEYIDPQNCPDFLISKGPPLVGDLLAKRKSAARKHRKRHDSIARNYDVTVIDINNAKEQSLVNKDLRDAARSHAEV